MSQRKSERSHLGGREKRRIKKLIYLDSETAKNDQDLPLAKEDFHWFFVRKIEEYFIILLSALL